MKTLHISTGTTIDTETGYQTIIGKHFDSFSADDFRLDDDGNAVRTGTVILTEADIKSLFHDMTGTAYDTIVFDDAARTYHIKPEYLSSWGSNLDSDYIVMEDELERLADEWETDIDTLREQLIEI